MKKTKVAVIGCGTIANSAHLPSYSRNPRAELAYVCDIIPERAEKALKEYGAGKAVTDYHEILADPTVTAVSLCVPNYLHATMAIDCLNAGKHVLCEKPAAVSYELALSMKQAANGWPLIWGWPRRSPTESNEGSAATIPNCFRNRTWP